jgi:cytidylate kinase
VGLTASRAGIDADQAGALAELARNMDVEFQGDRVFLDGEEVSLAIRTERAGNLASKVAAVPEVRSALLQWQRDYAREPGLVADGRDMGTVVFPGAAVKVFLTASAEERADRRYKQLKEKGLDANLPDLVAEIRERDERDSNRSVAPLIPAPDALEVESTALSIGEVLTKVLDKVYETWPDIRV